MNEFNLLVVKDVNHQVGPDILGNCFIASSLNQILAEELSIIDEIFILIVV